MTQSTTTLWLAAKVLRKHLQEVSSILTTQYPDYNHVNFLDACEQVSPSSVFDTGGELFDFFIIAFGEKKDSRTIARAASTRSRDRRRVRMTLPVKQYYIDQYLLRFARLK